MNFYSIYPAIDTWLPYEDSPVLRHQGGIDYHFENYRHSWANYLADLPGTIEGVLGECRECERYCTISSFSRLCQGCTIDAEVACA